MKTFQSRQLVSEDITIMLFRTFLLFGEICCLYLHFLFGGPKPWFPLKIWQSPAKINGAIIQNFAILITKFIILKHYIT
jgi:hypothetical protein